MDEAVREKPAARAPQRMGAESPTVGAELVADPRPDTEGRAEDGKAVGDGPRVLRALAAIDKASRSQDRLAWLAAVDAQDFGAVKRLSVRCRDRARSPSASALQASARWIGRPLGLDVETRREFLAILLDDPWHEAALGRLRRFEHLCDSPLELAAKLGKRALVTELEVERAARGGQGDGARLVHGWPEPPKADPAGSAADAPEDQATSDARLLARLLMGPVERFEEFPAAGPNAAPEAPRAASVGPRASDVVVATNAAAVENLKPADFRGPGQGDPLGPEPARAPSAQAAAPGPLAAGSLPSKVGQMDTPRPTSSGSAKAKSPRGRLPATSKAERQEGTSGVEEAPGSFMAFMRAVWLGDDATVERHVKGLRGALPLRATQARKLIEICRKRALVFTDRVAAYCAIERVLSDHLRIKAATSERAQIRRCARRSEVAPERRVGSGSSTRRL